MFLPKQTTNDISLWPTTAEEPDYQSQLEIGGEVIDLVIVGGGFTGLSAALHASEANFSSQVLEANCIGFGGSGRNVGLVNAGVWLPPDKVKQELGDRDGDKFLEIFGNAPSTVFELIENHQIRCEVTKTGTIHAAHAPSGFIELKQRYDIWKQLGAPVELLNSSEVSNLVGSDHFHGGLLDRRAGSINPMGYCRGLARAAVSAGAKISTGVRVERLIRESEKWRIVTSQGDVFARNVLLATNAYTDKLWPDLNRVFTPISLFQFATNPLGSEVAEILPDRQGVWDTGKILFSLRKDFSNRLILGSMGTVLGHRTSGISHRWAKKKLATLFPHLGDVEFECAWQGKIAMTPNHLPQILKLDQGVYTAIGYNGRGITTGTVLGKVVTEVIRLGRDDNLPLPITQLSKSLWAPLTSRLYWLAFAGNQVYGSFK